LRGRIGVEGRDVDNVVETAAGGLQHGFQIIEGKLYLLCEIGFGRAVFTAADLAGDEEKVTGADRR